MRKANSPTPRKKAKRRTSVERPHNGGEWTEARKTSFIKSALRAARWPPKFAAISEAKVGKRTNPESGRMCTFFKCAICSGEFVAEQMRSDHIEPVVPIEGFTSWDQVIERLFVEKEGFQAICVGCHDVKTAEERNARREMKKAKELTQQELL